jgi:hypothetical protein
MGGSLSPILASWDLEKSIVDTLDSKRYFKTSQCSLRKESPGRILQSWCMSMTFWLAAACSVMDVSKPYCRNLFRRTWVWRSTTPAWGLQDSLFLTSIFVCYPTRLAMPPTLTYRHFFTMTSLHVDLAPIRMLRSWDLFLGSLRAIRETYNPSYSRVLWLLNAYSSTKTLNMTEHRKKRFIVLLIWSLKCYVCAGRYHGLQTPWWFSHVPP